LRRRGANHRTRTLRKGKGYAEQGKIQPRPKVGKGGGPEKRKKRRQDLGHPGPVFNKGGLKETPELSGQNRKERNGHERLTKKERQNEPPQPPPLLRKRCHG